ncbi:arsenate reductase (glutaredoxin) [Pseudoxanthomonas broegbernensis]|uniref:Arsenate reductase n=1 Tax=Pseudoxanthomonas broegbernensis TaxID=83619 RepID=A0A7V8K8R5_9GAMM|nr:arsenate reductase (glutaredoxin) [Pseudoxanthomonas broegbernensis]KAF1688097.1 arsenate reductase (glutaredoxin) [Pseudoxanthomonas broegbernensis]MBB6065136.1 arsenate reductase [Pseudoxanthomonas broegbernensis]
MPAGAQATIWHNPRCSNSRGALQLLREHGIEPRIVDYLARPPDRAALLRAAADSGVGLRGLVRDKEAIYRELDLDGADDAVLLDAMLAHPVLINRPVVITARGTRLCRPPETVLELLPGG